MEGQWASHSNVHHSDDEAWHVFEGELTFRYADHTQIVAAGQTFLSLPVWHIPTRPDPKPGT